MNEWLYARGATAIAGLLLVLFLVAWNASYRAGLAVAKRRPAGSDSQGLAIEAAILTLFALLLGFTFSMSANRYESRKDATLQEANAIGTAYLRADLLPATERKRMRETLRGYLDTRLEFYGTPFHGTSERADRLQSDAWSLAVAEARTRPTPPSALLVHSLNEMIDLREKQLVAFENTVPQVVLLFLFALSLLAVGIIGYMNGTHGERRLALSVAFCAVVTMTLYLLLDLDRPRRGLLRLDHESLHRLKRSLSVE